MRITLGQFIFRGFIMSMPRDEYKGKKVAFLKGIAAEPYPQIGDVVYYD